MIREVKFDDRVRYLISNYLPMQYVLNTEGQ